MTGLKTEELLSFIGGGSYEYTLDAPASELTSFRTGGKVAVVVYPKNKGALCALLRFLLERDAKHITLGCGTNVLAPDEGYDGVFVMTQRMTGISLDGSVMTVGAGEALRRARPRRRRRGSRGLSSHTEFPAASAARCS